MSLFLRLLPGSRSASSAGDGFDSRNERPSSNADDSTASMPFGHSSFGPGSTTSLLPSVAALPETRQLVVMQAVKHLLHERHFSVCQLDKVLDLMDAPRKSEAYRLLSALHCVNYTDMPADLRNRIPHLINEALRPQAAISCDAVRTAVSGLEF